LCEEAFYDDTPMKGFLNKYGGQCLTIALISAYINDKKEVGSEDIVNAIMVVEYFRIETEKIFKKEKLSKEDKIIQKIIEYSKKKKVNFVLKSDLYLNKIGRIRNAKEAKNILEKMQSLKLGKIIKKKFIFYDNVS